MNRPNTAQPAQSNAQTQQQGGNPGSGIRNVDPNTQAGGQQNQQQQPMRSGQTTQNAPASPQTSESARQSPPASAQQPQQQTRQPAGMAQQPARSQPQQTGQTTDRAQQPAQSQPQQTGRPAGVAQQPVQSQQRQTGSQTQPTQTAPQTAQQRSSGVVALNARQQTQIGQTIARHNVRPLTNVNFSIAVGTRVPQSVTLRALPSDLVAFVPQYRGYSYFVVEEQIVIVEPATHEIVSVIPYASSGRTVSRSSSRSAAAPMTSRSVNLNTEQRDVIRRHATTRRTVRETAAPRVRYGIGDRVDRSVTIEAFPETIYTEVPIIRQYRYFTDDADVVLVDPYEDRVVEIIR